MAEKQAEDDDDEGFGEFKFASSSSSFSSFSSFSFPNHTVTVHSNQMNGSDFFSNNKNEDDDDDWGDFINNSSPQIAAQSELSNGLAHTQSPPNFEPSKPLGAFGFFSDHSPKPSDSVSSPVVSESESGVSRVELEKKEWIKPQGALPLSIFGDVEQEKEEEEGEASGVGGAAVSDANELFVSKRVDSARNGSSLNMGIGIDNIIANLYNQNEQIKANNGPTSNSNALDSNFNGLSSIASPYNQSEHIKAENGLISNSNGLDSIGNLYNQSEQIKAENGLNSNSNGLNLNVKGLDSNVVEGDHDDDDDDDGWEFKVAESERGGENSKEVGNSGLFGLEVEAVTIDQEIEVGGEGQKNSKGVEYSSGFGNGTHGFSDLFTTSDGVSYKSSELDIGFGFEPSAVIQNGFISNSYTENKQNETGNGLNPYPVDGNVDSDENLWEFKDAFSENGPKHKEVATIADHSRAGVDVSTHDGEIQVKEIRSENHEGALPLSLFSDGKLESDDSLNHQDVFAYKPHSYLRNGINSHSSNMSFDDIILSLYSQAEKIPSVDSTEKQTVNELVSTKMVLDSNLVSGDDDYDDSVGEFKDAFLDARAKDQTSVLMLGVGDTHQNVSKKLNVESYVDFYAKLKDELHLVALCHLDSLKEARSVAALSSEDAKVVALDKEIQEAYKELHQENVVSEEAYTENHPPSISCLSEFLEVLQEPKFQVLESEYHLSRRLSLAGKDLGSAIELLKHATSTLKILTLGSMEEQSSYVSMWSKMISVCGQELNHGASIWKQSLQNNVHSQILSEPRGQQFILALGEIYRVVEIVGASAKLYKPWILSSFADPTSIFALLDECCTLWSSSGLEAALQGISDPIGFEYDGTIKTLLESIKRIQDLDTVVLQNHFLTQHERICRLSVLTPEVVPDMKMVVWNGEHYFLALANLWANLISHQRPTLPQICVG